MKKSKKNSCSIWMPDTFIIIFFVVLFAAALTYVIPVGKYDTQEITYRDTKGNELSKTVVDPDSYTMERQTNGRPVRRGIPLFKEGGEVGLTNYAFEGLVSGDKWGSAGRLKLFLGQVRLKLELWQFFTKQKAPRGP